MVGTQAYYLGNICDSKIQDGRHYIHNDIFWLIGMTRTCSWCLVVCFWVNKSIYGNYKCHKTSLMAHSIVTFCILTFKIIQI